MSSTLIAALRINESLYSLLAKTTPGESIRIMFLSSQISYKLLVKPGVLPVGAALDLFNELMSEDFPTFGNPTIPTTIYYFALPPSTLA
jgi:hypothetical protein